jgi:hypothetical protein
MTECDVVESVVGHLAEKGYRVHCEVPFWLRRIDIVATRVGGRGLLAVEAKVSDWRVALRQATMCQLCAHRVYVAMPAAFVHRCDEAAFRAAGVGLLTVAGDAVATTLRAKLSSVFCPGHHKDLVAVLARRRSKR